MPVGFKLPSGTASNAHNLIRPGEMMDLAADPFAPGVNFTRPSVDKPSEFDALFSRRYGHAKQIPGDSFALPDTHGHGHTSDEGGYLENIFAHNPGWFAAMGFGDAAGQDGASTQREQTDAMFAAGVGDLVFAESNRLAQVTPPIDPPPPPPPPPIDPIDPPPPPPPPPVQVGEVVPVDVEESLKVLGRFAVGDVVKAGRLRHIRRVARFFAGVQRVNRG